MKHGSLLMSLSVAAVLAAGGYGLYTLGVQRGAARPGSVIGVMPGSAAAAAPMKAGDIDPATGRKVLYWHDPMAPDQKFDRPGKSPFMDMMLVPVYAGGGDDQGGVSVSPRVRESLGVRTAEVTRGTMAPRVEAVGSIAFNERDQAVVQARATGYVEHLYVRATLDRVVKGRTLLELYVPDWVAAQEEFLSVRHMQGADLAPLIDGARERMRQAGMDEQQIRVVETSGEVQPRITLESPIDGVVAELMVREGMTVMPGTTLFRINGLSTVWVNAEVPESQAGLLRAGAPVQARSASLPATVFKGRVQAILPEVNPATRTLKARVELANPGAQLAPGMFVSVALAARNEPALIVPSEAVIRTGERAVVMLAEAGGTFRPVDVQVGIESNGQTEIKRGLQAGQKVVVSGEFLVDSEASLKATEMRMAGTPETKSPEAVVHTGEGRVKAVQSDAVTLSHGPIPSMQWGAMTMNFSAPAGGLPADLKPGQAVRFSFKMKDDGRPVLTRIEPWAPAVPAPNAAASSIGAAEQKQ